MADIQIDIGFAILLIGWPVYHLLSGPPYTKRDDAFYTHLSNHSAVFPRWRWIFPLMWTLLWSFNGAGAWLFWHAYAAGDNDTTYLVGLILYTISFVFQCGWYNMFFKRRMLKSTFWVTLIVIWGSQVGYFVCTILYPEVVSAVASGLLVAWLTYATLMTGVAAFYVPDHDNGKMSEPLVDPELPAGSNYHGNGAHLPHHHSGHGHNQHMQQGGYASYPPYETPVAANIGAQVPPTVSAAASVKFNPSGNTAGVQQRKGAPSAADLKSLGLKTVV